MTEPKRGWFQRLTEGLSRSSKQMGDQIAQAFVVKAPLDQAKLDELEEMLDPDKWYRISRSFYISVNSVEQIHDYFGNRLLLYLKPSTDKEALVSREKVTEFKKWLGK